MNIKIKQLIDIDETILNTITTWMYNWWGIKDGYSFDDFVKVIDCKVSDWKDNPDMNKYLRPSTLFRPGNFENYLNESKGNKYERIKREGGGLLIDSEYRSGLKEQTGRLDFQ